MIKLVARLRYVFGLQQMRPLKLVAACCLLMPTFGCDGGAAREAADCAASRELYQRIVAAACAPWGEDRESALGDLIDAARDQRLEEPVTGEQITDWANEIGPEECAKAGYPNPGKRPKNPKRERELEEARAQVRRDIPKAEADRIRTQFQEEMARQPKCSLKAE